MSGPHNRFALILGLILTVQTAVLVGKYGIEVANGARFGGDFLSFWDSARHLRSGHIEAIYDAAAWRAQLQGGEQLAWFVYPPYALFGLWPLGRLDYNSAVFWWSVVPLPVYFMLIGCLVRKWWPASAGGRASATLFAMALSLPFLTANLFSGQTGAWLALPALAAALFWKDRPWLAGICIGLLALKPQFGLLLPIAVMASGQWRTFVAAAATVIGLVVASMIAFGIDTWLGFFGMWRLFGDFIAADPANIRQLALSPFISLRSVGTPAGPATLVQSIVSIAAVIVFARLFARGRRSMTEMPQDLSFAALAVGMFAATPYSLVYDTPLLILALIPLVIRAWDRGWSGLDCAAVAAVVAAPLAMPDVASWGVPFGLISLMLLGAAIARHSRGEAQLLSLGNEENGSPGLIRTGGRPINSRMLYR